MDTLALGPNSLGERRKVAEQREMLRSGWSPNPVHIMLPQ